MIAATTTMSTQRSRTRFTCETVSASRLWNVSDRVDELLRRRRFWLSAMGSAFAIAIGVLLLVWVRSLARSADGLTTDTGARSGLIALAVALLVAVAFRGVHLWAPRLLRLVGPIVTVVFASVAAVLFGTGRLDIAYSLYGGLQVLRSDKLFSDTHWVLSWFECDFCSRWDPHYGPTLAWLDPLTAGTIGLAWLAPVGILLTALGAFALWLLAGVVRPIGLWLVAVSSFSPAWLLLVDRANADMVVLVALVIGLLVVAKHPSLISWSLYALGVWILGTIKFFPFAMGIGLLLALGVEKGWRVIAGFLVASVAFAGVAWESYQRSSEWNATAIVVLGDFPAYGRIQLTDMISGLDAIGLERYLVPIALSALVVSASLWGWGAVVVPADANRRIAVAALATTGAMGFLGKVLWGGFGFLYSGAFLLMIIPLLSVWSGRKSLVNGSNASVALLLVLSVFTAYNTALATVSGLIVAGFGLGAGLRITAVVWRERRNSSTPVIA